MRELSHAELGNEPIDPDLKACILAELATQPGSRVIKRKGRLFFKTKHGFEILRQRLCEVKARWLELVEYADLTHEEKWLIFRLMMCGDARLEEVPGLGLKVTLPASPRH
jgi:hypothetical protein